jgi:hypothetical protein
MDVQQLSIFNVKVDKDAQMKAIQNKYLLIIHDILKGKQYISKFCRASA